MSSEDLTGSHVAGYDLLERVGEGGTATVYRASYVVTSTKGGSCAWILFVTDTDGYEALMASAYPVDETIRDSETDTGLAVGAAVARVESDCPKWSASLTATGP